MPSHHRDSGPLVPHSCVVAEATSTTEATIAIPSRTRVIEVTGATAKHYLAVTDSATPPTLGESNSCVLQIGATVTIYPRPHLHTHLHVAATASTGTVDVNFWR